MIEQHAAELSVIRSYFTSFWGPMIIDFMHRIWDEAFLVICGEHDNFASREGLIKLLESCWEISYALLLNSLQYLAIFWSTQLFPCQTFSKVWKEDVACQMGFPMFEEQCSIQNQLKLIKLVLLYTFMNHLY